MASNDDKRPVSAENVKSVYGQLAYGGGGVVLFDNNPDWLNGVISSQWVSECDLSESAYNFSYIEIYQVSASFYNVGSFDDIFACMNRYPMKSANFDASVEALFGSYGLKITASGYTKSKTVPFGYGAQITLTNDGTHIKGERIFKVVGYR